MSRHVLLIAFIHEFTQVRSSTTTYYFEASTVHLKVKTRWNAHESHLGFTSFANLMHGKCRSPDSVIAKPDNIIVVNPSVVYQLADKKYLMFFKGNHYIPRWQGVYGVAFSSVNRLERPQLLLDENDNPIVLYAACAWEDVNPSKDGLSFNVQITIKTTKVPVAKR